VVNVAMTVRDASVSNPFKKVYNNLFLINFYFLCKRKKIQPIIPKNPYLKVYLVKPSRCQELAGPCNTLVKAGSSKSDLWDFRSTCKYISLKNLLASS
jgi:hypothetical protein